MKNNRLIIISYRLPFSFKTENKTTTLKPSAGGLVTAVKSLDLSASSQKPIWIGCADFTQSVWEKSKHLVNDDFEYVPVFLDKAVNKGFYNGFSNSVLWPLFHYFPGFVDYHDEYLTAYQAANQAVCEKVIEHLKPTDMVWVHDYHFLALPQLIREREPEATIGFFLHIPFPSNELLRLLPRRCRDYLLEGLLGADLIGFHTNDYLIHFLQSVSLNLGLSHNLAKVLYQDRGVQCQAFPIGINYGLYHDAYAQPDVVSERDELKKSYPGKIIFSVDRLDYTKGVMQRLDALEAFLQSHPEWKGNLVFILVVVPSRDEIQTYWERKQMIEQAVGRINGKFATLTWVPIVYRYASLAFPQLIALYTACDVAMITPLRDGMNLVAKEFIATRQDQQGVLLLSELTGAANELGDALLVNPLDEYEVADQLNVALMMPPEEQQRRMAVMQRRVEQYDVKQWANDFFDALAATRQGKRKNHVRSLKGTGKHKLTEAFERAQSRLLLIDYDGTLVEFTNKPELTAPSAQVKELLNTLTQNSQNKVVVMSERSHEKLEELLDGLPVDIVAEHGTYLRQEGGWRSSVLDDGSWKDTVRPLMADFVSRCEGSSIEEKNHSLAWHYRSVADDIGFDRSREMLTTLMALLPHQLRVIDGNKVIEVKNVDTDKGRMAKQLAFAFPYDFVLAIGDDRTDEDMFSALAGQDQYTIKIGKGATNAAYRLDNVQQVLDLLSEFANHPAKEPASSSAE
ncbi:bifunctional alpha,alpha-trehalose-phosphate synthase (UDP-forming)/trehalose-phosphatase [Spirosoma sp. RP8]|uniref:Bifunctional alpha,alpha-trehalose-phosphate synthase (UDP-forming)/trehalose-phosphatase n=1 Tax=Spirosoma liriopis TaxID=2937440 RepID=A0ABT0HSJ7_9BACT|nr:bifunctional alpha,alpha-trehalose-phosphate synthase (UDP-forming)/trehalose-phosphatase [Spirosoma liriopis]MCK8495150.1 bifunctional alpha,alpha-trehalose-phosphate synthase (UDP-forming)/trehalose-phosphatase [Spirosoma liriopis]